MNNSSFLHPSFLLLKSFCFRISSIRLEVHQKFSAARRIFKSQRFMWWWNSVSNHHFLNLRGEYWGLKNPLKNTTIIMRKKIDHSCSKTLVSPGVKADAIRSWRKRNGKQKTKAFKTREFPNSTLFISEYGIITGLMKTVEFTLLSYRNPDFRLGPGSAVGEKGRKKKSTRAKKIRERSELNGCCFTPFFAVFPTSSSPRLSGFKSMRTVIFFFLSRWK